jgi:hypothetical protein
MPKSRFKQGSRFKHWHSSNPQLAKNYKLVGPEHSSRFKHSSNPQLAKYILVGLELPPLQLEHHIGSGSCAVCASGHAIPALAVLSPGRLQPENLNLKQLQVGQLTGPLFSKPAGPLDRPADPRIGHRAHCMSAQHSAIKALPEYTGCDGTRGQVACSPGQRQEEAVCKPDRLGQRTI